MKIFAYGTLMRDFWNYPIMQRAKGRFLSTGKLERRELYNVGGFPGVIYGKGEVHGEIFEVPDEKVHEVLDRLEGYHPDELPEFSAYLRKKALATLPNGKKVWVSYYHWNRAVNPDRKYPDGRFRKEW